MNITKQTNPNVGWGLKHGSKFGIAWSSTRFRWGWSTVLFPFPKLLKDDRSVANLLSWGKPYIWRMCLVLATGPGYPAAVRVWTGKTVRFGSRPVQIPDPQFLGGPNPDPYPSTRGFCRVWLDPSVPISGLYFRVFLFMVAFRYPTLLCKILTLVHSCLYLPYWLPFYWKHAKTSSLLHHEVVYEWFFVSCHE